MAILKGAIEPDTAWEGCAIVVEAASRTCTAPPQGPVASAAQQDFSAMATSFASLSAALTWGSIIIAVVGIIGGLAWGKIIAHRAENEARTEAKKQASLTIEKWLEDEAPAIIRSHVEKLRDATLGDGDDDDAADAMGEAAG